MFSYLMKYSTYLTLTYLTFLATIYPNLRAFGMFGIFLFLAYMVADTFKIYHQAKIERRDRQPIEKAIAENGQYILYFVIALSIGLFLGLS